jgi:hypothetical protein
MTASQAIPKTPSGALRRRGIQINIPKKSPAEAELFAIKY